MQFKVWRHQYVRSLREGAQTILNSGVTGCDEKFQTGCHILLQICNLGVGVPENSGFRVGVPNFSTFRNGVDQKNFLFIPAKLAHVHQHTLTEPNGWVYQKYLTNVISHTMMNSVVFNWHLPVGCPDERISSTYCFI